MANKNGMSPMEDLLFKYRSLGAKAKTQGKMVLNHICLRVENLDEAVELLQTSFGLPEFLSPGGDTFEQEKEYRVAWLDDHDLYLELSEYECPQAIGYDTGVGQPIGHLSEVGFFVPNMESALSHLKPMGWRVESSIQTSGARMLKLYNETVPGIPVELIDLEDPESENFLQDADPVED